MAVNFFGLGERKFLPTILQVETSECGLACIAMIAAFYELNLDLTSLRKRFSVSSHGLNMRYMIEIARSLGFSAKAVKVEYWAIRNLQLPVIIHWEMNHFVVLKKISNKKFFISDPSIGERILTVSEFNLAFTGVALELRPNKDFKKIEKKQHFRLGDFFKKIVGLKKNIYQVIMLSLLLQFFAVLSPFFIQAILDEVIPQDDINLLLVLLIGFFLLLLIEVVTIFLREKIIVYAASHLNIQLASNVFYHLIRLPIDYFNKRHIGDIVSRFGGLASIREILTTGFVSAVVDGVMAVIMLCAMFLFSIKLTVVAISFILIYGLFRWILFKPLKLLREEYIISTAKENSHFIESVRAIQTIKLSQREDCRQAQWENKLIDVINKDVKIRDIQIIEKAIKTFFWGASSLLITFISAKLIINHQMSIGILVAFIGYKIKFFDSIDKLIEKCVEYIMFKIQLERLSDIVFSEKEKMFNAHVNSNGIDYVQISEIYSPSRSIGGAIEVKGLSYQFNGAESFIFKNIDLRIEAGEAIAITGVSGCGKTTLLKCLIGLINPTAGQIYVDEVPLMNHLMYRSQIACVMQDDMLISGDIYDNISCFDSEFDKEWIESCAEMACIHEDIMAMPMKYYTLIGEMGAALSGGQKQRIYLARALYRKPKILFMDEATSHLDVLNEFRVNENIKKMNITRIFVAHRLETISLADKVINLSE